MTQFLVCRYIIFASVGPGIHLEELEQLEVFDVVLFGLGMLCIVVGIGLMVSGVGPDKPYFQPMTWRDPDGLILNENGEWEYNMTTEVPLYMLTRATPKNKMEYEAAEKALKELKDQLETVDKRNLREFERANVPWYKKPLFNKEGASVIQGDADEKKAEAFRKEMANAEQRKQEILNKRNETKGTTSNGLSTVPLLLMNNI